MLSCRYFWLVPAMPAIGWFAGSRRNLPPLEVMAMSAEQMTSRTTTASKRLSVPNALATIRSDARDRMVRGIQTQLATFGSDGHERGTNDQQNHHGEQEAFGPECLGDNLCCIAPENPTQDGAPADHAEDAFCFARGEQIIRQGPHLSWRQDSKHADPNIKDRIEPG